MQAIFVTALLWVYLHLAALTAITAIGVSPLRDKPGKVIASTT